MNFNKNLFPEDKMMVAVKHESSCSYIDQLLNGTRKAETEHAQAIIADLETLAAENVQFRLAKAELLGVSL